ncbi:MAG: hypothetical protein OEZ68_14185 [Gammaproteobacteria bacterium]|nr:hypothetical protein [Gammaproteobacteria bacterium]MDH5801952.1 hypothetical protein [Gammaproteobacteria bacterium]
MATSYSDTSYANQLKPFTSDGCSVFPDGTITQKDLWLACCTEHDKAYWQGGTYEERVTADEALKNCVASLGQTFISTIMREGVRVGGSPRWPTKFRWGYGWIENRGYQALTEDEKKQAKELLKNSKPPAKQK